MRRAIPFLAPLLVVGCVSSPSEPAPVTEVVTSTAQPEPPVVTDLQPLIDAAVATHGGTAGVAVSDGADTLVAGDAGGHVAWSTIKVPIAVAALRADPALAPVAGAAIRSSDNAAAETLWASLGPPEAAADATESVVAETGVVIDVTETVTRPGFSSFGQTPWTVSDQAVFAAGLGCVAGADAVLTDMAWVDPDQRYGLGQFPGARFKGGWGPDPDGGYTVRQFGLIPTDHGEVGVALWVKPASASYLGAQAMATQLASDLGERLAGMPATACDR
ncbi:hypothetical protein [Corynebacterium suedekumii]|uniref:Beta-lactamase class A n=1 Tax=Corynebacterium suedekumii TaxID=3049801 RepID=A0ABY8VHP8_9CORY|nr:hypothetical protein [Corynebacterium suedekumii]WIM69180.1 hypothetical protein QP029_07745 [Corynebacterium suedekumii]